ncbi:small-conductance mechanosensitive channel [Rivularia sp. PCC 7116]|uniref:mechanosensitive ion channel domain-containing protein n=1 Tax=Rivularia sp. PCC 7116 TaxID=373994 RepID=UPI00029F102C|nr:mechanosensitive ion channel domain-containing protein [Rivularia sp. PCC 7116]AFY57847.1 small-conductance mechanosensitive channel [Rivularia sp. PCC 7116]
MGWFQQLRQNILVFFRDIYKAELFKLDDGKSFTLDLFLQLIFYAVIAYIIGSLISRLISKTILSRFKIDRGTKEAISSVVGYLIAGIGFLIVLRGAGIDLSSLTVIAGVLGLGIGFGLQNISSNFISGITLLFEQPLKVGDLVEVDDLRGIVEKISIRSTVVRTLDNVFVIVPNQKFIENNIVNWSYRDKKCRVHIPVGVAYGTDTTLVTEALLAAARRHPRVLKQPTPKVWFKEFGDSSLNFELLVWVDEPPGIPQFKSDLNFSIENELNLRNINIPFPQRDLHLKNPQDLIQLFQGAGNLKVSDSNVSNDSPKTKIPDTASNSSGTQSLKDLLRQISYFQNCTPRQIRELIEQGFRQMLPPEQVICREGDPGNSFYVILSGSVEIYSEKLNKHIVNRHAGEFIGEMALLMGIPRSASIRTNEQTTLFVVDHTNLQRLLSNHPQLADQISAELATRSESLASMGILPEKIDSEQGMFKWIRSRINTLFEI